MLKNNNVTELVKTCPGQWENVKKNSSDVPILLEVKREG